jgi:hypothetical protein
MSKLARISKVMSDTGHKSKIQNVLEQAKELGHQHFAEGFPCSKELVEFIQGVKKAMPKVKFYP